MSSAEFRAPAGNLLDESNALSYLPDKRNAQADYYRLENRERQLMAISSLTPAEASYVLGRDAGSSDADKVKWQEEIKNNVQKLHEKDLIELKALVYLQQLPDTSPELIQLKTYCGCDTREQIAGFIAEKQIKKLFLSQIEAITAGKEGSGGGTLSAVYRDTIQRGPTTFSKLFQ